MMYREYITESIRLHNENKYLPYKYIDAIYKAPERHIDGRKLVDDFIARAGIEVI